MDWSAISFDWNRARAFLVTAEEGSFSAASRALAISQPTIGRQVTALEQELDVVLFERVGHGLKLTAAGQDLVEHVRTMGEAALRISLVAAGHSLTLEGSVCISASQLTAIYTLPAILESLRVKHPGIEVEVIVTNSVSDLGRREADIAIRSFRPTQPELLARKVRDDCAYLYAAKSYLEKLGDPTTPEGLSQANFMGFDRSDRLLKALNGLGFSLTASQFPIITESQLVQWELTKRGAGIAIMMAEIGDQEPLVRRVLPDLPPFPLPMWLTTHRELKTSRRMRVVFDHLFEGLRAHDGVPSAPQPSDPLVRSPLRGIARS